MITPLSNNVLIRRHPAIQTSLIVIPDGIAASNRGTVLAVGPGKLGKKGGRIPVDVKVGDTVLFYELAEIHEPSGMTQNPFNRVSEDSVMINEKYIQMVLG